MNIKQIKADQVQARKDRDSTTATLLTTLLGEIQTRLTKLPESDRAAKESEITTAVINNFLKLNRESQGHLSALSDSEPMNVLKHEETVLMRYQPKYLTAEEIADRMEFLTFNSKGEFFAFLKKHHAGEYMGSTASEAFELIQARKS